jgi:hypothetical protein
MGGVRTRHKGVNMHLAKQEPVKPLLPICHAVLTLLPVDWLD